MDGKRQGIRRKFSFNPSIMTQPTSYKLHKDHLMRQRQMIFRIKRDLSIERSLVKYYLHIWQEDQISAIWRQNYPNLHTIQKSFIMCQSRGWSGI